ncbi:bifunctional riboflavin kinase/FAD synthetase [Marinactinospora endophytica]
MEEIPRDWGRSVVAIGVFDGVHRGHQEVLARAAELARKRDLPLVVVTFDAAGCAGAARPAVLTGPRHKTELLERFGASAVCVPPSVPEPDDLSDEGDASRFVARLGADTVVTGPGVGEWARGGVEALRALGDRRGFAVEEVPVLTDEGAPVTSERVRGAVAEGAVEEARRLLGRPHRVEGIVVHGAARGRELLGFPTANLDSPVGSAVPADGVYAGRLLRLSPASGQEAGWPAAVSVGTNPTFEGGERTVEAYALDRDDLDLYGEEMAVEFTHRIRPTLRFDGIDELIAAMERDVERTRELLAGE